MTDFKLDDTISGVYIDTGRVTSYVSVDDPVKRDIKIAHHNGNIYRIAKPYFSYDVDGVPRETERPDLPFCQWGECKVCDA